LAERAGISISRQLCIVDLTSGKNSALSGVKEYLLPSNDISAILRGKVTRKIKKADFLPPTYFFEFFLMTLILRNPIFGFCI